MNFSYSLARTRFSNGAAKVRIIFKLPNFFETFFKKIFSGRFLRQSFQELSASSATRFSNGSAKVRLFN
jgi:hypothetical protein